MADKSAEKMPNEFDPEKVRYIKNELGGVHQVSDEHFWLVLHELTNSGNRFLLPGWSEISEAEAKKANPQIFGVDDPQVTKAAGVKPIQNVEPVAAAE